MTAPNLPDTRAWHRPDITGLRSLAIIPVVLFHAGLTFIPGGFVGVDVFYAISGYLITTLLVRDASTGQLHLGRFWARRLRRLLPASVAMIAATLVAGLIILSPFRWAELGQEALSALTYWSNFHFAFQKTDYFAQEIAIPSPLIHTWSLGVEEQFYVIWPVIILIVALLTRKSKRGLRFHLSWVFAVVGVASLALSIVWSSSHPSYAFYLLPTRAWEFALAGLAALAFPFLRLPRWSRSVAGLVGAVILIASLFVIDSGTDFPGTAALFPVGGTLLLILAGPHNAAELPSIPARILSLRPFVWIGDISYSWYLWHWPLIVLVPLALGNDSLWVTVGAAIVSLPIAWASYRFLENPIRFHPRLVKSIAFTLAVSILAVAPVTTASAIAIYAGDHSGTPTVDGVKVDLNAARFPPTPKQCTRTSQLPSGTSICESGDLASDRVMLLVGDSHAAHWAPAFSLAAAKEHVRLVLYWRPACPVVPVKITTTDGENGGKLGCAGERTRTRALVKELRPQSVVLSQTDAYNNHILSADGKAIPMATQLDVWEAAYNQLLDSLQPYAGRVSVILDNPRLVSDPNDCLARPGATFGGCAEPLAEATAADAPIHERTAQLLRERGITTLDAASLVCKNGVCPVYADGELVWHDVEHLTAPWVRTQAENIRPFIRAALIP